MNCYITRSESGIYRCPHNLKQIQHEKKFTYNHYSHHDDSLD